MNLQIQIKFLDFLYKMMSGDIERLPHATYTPQKMKFIEGSGSQISLKRSVPEREGVSSKLIRKFYEEIAEDRRINAHSLMILRHGKVIASGSFKPYKAEYGHISHSMCKSVTAMAVGIAVAEGRFGIEDRVVDFFPEQKTLFRSKRVKNITVWHLLTMSSGIRFNELGSVFEDNWVKGFLESDVSFEPGSKFEYNSMNTYMLSAIIKKTTKEGLLAYLRERLFEPLGICNVTWELCPMGIEKGGWGLSLCLEDMAKLGQLYLKKGVWKCQGEEKQLVPKTWVEESTKVQIVHNEDKYSIGYGYQTWICEDRAFLFNGMFGQNVLVMPELDMVIAMTAGSFNFFPSGGTMECIEKYFRNKKNFKDKKLEIDLKEYKRLRWQLNHLEFTKSAVKKETSWKDWIFLIPKKAEKKRDMERSLNLQRKLDGNCYSMEEPIGAVIPLMIQCMHNNYSRGVGKLKFKYIEDHVMEMKVKEGRTVNKIRIGFREAEYSDYVIQGESYKVGAFGKFTKDEDGNRVLKMYLSFVETSNTRLLKIFFLQNDKIRIEMDEIPSIPFVFQSFEKENAEGQIGKLPFIKDKEYLKYKLNKVVVPAGEGRLVKKL